MIHFFQSYYLSYFVPNGRCFLAPWNVSINLLLLFKHDRRNQICRNGEVFIHFDVQRGSANRQTSFSGRGNAWKKLPFLGYIVKKFRRPTILQLNIKGLTASKINVLYYLALQSETLITYYRRPTARAIT